MKRGLSACDRWLLNLKGAIYSLKEVAYIDAKLYLAFEFLDYDLKKSLDATKQPMDPRLVQGRFLRLLPSPSVETHVNHALFRVTCTNWLAASTTATHTEFSTEISNPATF